MNTTPVTASITFEGLDDTDNKPLADAFLAWVESQNIGGVITMEVTRQS